MRSREICICRDRVDFKAALSPVATWFCNCRSRDPTSGPFLLISGGVFYKATPSGQVATGGHLASKNTKPTLEAAWELFYRPQLGLAAPPRALFFLQRRLFSYRGRLLALGGIKPHPVVELTINYGA